MTTKRNNGAFINYHNRTITALLVLISHYLQEDEKANERLPRESGTMATVMKAVTSLKASTVVLQHSTQSARGSDVSLQFWQQDTKFYVWSLFLLW